MMCHRYVYDELRNGENFPQGKRERCSRARVDVDCAVPRITAETGEYTSESSFFLTRTVPARRDPSRLTLCTMISQVVSCNLTLFRHKTVTTYRYIKPRRGWMGWVAVNPPGGPRAPRPLS